MVLKHLWCKTDDFNRLSTSHSLGWVLACLKVTNLLINASTLLAQFIELFVYRLARLRRAGTEHQCRTQDGDDGTASTHGVFLSCSPYWGSAIHPGMSPGSTFS